MPEVIHVFSEQDSKGRLLEEVHRLHNCLVVSRDELDDMRKARDFHGANSAYLMRERDRLLGEIEEMSKLREEAPAPVDAGLVERMIVAYETARGSVPEAGMTAALNVAANALLGPVIDEELGFGDIDDFIATRRARLLAPAKSAEERVRVEQRGAADGSWEVWEDENYCGNHSERNAKALRLGLIATLKQEPRP